MFASLARGKSEIWNCLKSEDVESTENAFQTMGCEIEVKNDRTIIIGRGRDGLIKPVKDLYMGNSGTTTRLLCGIMAAQKFSARLTGDKSLSSRPMKRIIDPLSLMGARIISNNGFLPIEISAVESLVPISYKLPIASAQIKSSLLLAGLHLDTETVIIEDKKSRDHTERMLNLRISEESGIRKIYSSANNYPDPGKYIVPSDISTASFFIILALLLEESELILPHVSLNESRTGLLDLLKEMGADIVTENFEIINGEPRGDITVRSSKLKNVDIPEEMIPNIIDEIPILAIAGIYAEGDFNIKNASELRFKESDRIKSVCENLKLLDLSVEEFEDGFKISGEPKSGHVHFESYGDHRIAMAFAILSLIRPGGGTINDFECVSISNPSFIDQLNSII
jgi:3-phosphoshikimate 1-carboxyvinyltransferase